MNKKPIKKATATKHTPRKNQAIRVNDKRNRIYYLTGLIIVILLGIIIYSNSFKCSFQFDDGPNIVNNTKIQDLSDFKSIFNYWPLRFTVNLSFAINYHFSQLNVLGYHIFNLFIHLVNSILVGWLTLLIFSSPMMKEQKIIKHKYLLAFFTALLFVSFPLATQSVTYIIQRAASGVTMFYLLSVAFYLKARLTDKKSATKIIWFSTSVLSGILAMFTKENAFTLPLAVALIEFFFIRKIKFVINLKDYRWYLFFAGLICIIIIVLKIAFSAFKPIPPDLGHTDTVTSANYLLTQFSVILKYIQLLFLPINQMLDYDFSLSISFFEIRTLISFIVLSGLLVLGIFLYKKYRILSFGIFWFFITLSVESSIIPIADVIFEHRTYLPSYGFFLILIFGIYSLLWKKYKYITIAFFSFITIFYSILTYQRNKVWKDEFSLWNDNVIKAPGIARPYNNRGLAYYNLGQTDKAIADYSKAILINPNYAEPYNNRGSVYHDFGQNDKAIADYSEAILINSNFAEPYNNRGIVYLDMKQWDKAIADCSKAIKINTNYAKAYCNRGLGYANKNDWNKAINDYSKAILIDPDYANPYYYRSSAYDHLGQHDKAISDYSKAVSIDTASSNAYYIRGLAFMKINKYEEAIADYSKALIVDPGSKEIYCARGVAYFNIKEWNKAIADYTAGINIDPKYKDAYYNRGIVYGKINEWKSAIKDYSKAIQIDPLYKEAYVNRGLAYGNIGQLDQAINDYTVALQIDPGFTIAYNNRENTYKKLRNKSNK